MAFSQQNPVQIPAPSENPLFCGEAIAVEISPNASAGVLSYVKRAPERSEGHSAKFTRESQPQPNAAKPPRDAIDEALECAEFAQIAEQIEADYNEQIEKILNEAKSYEEAFAAVANAQLKSERLDAAMAAALSAASEQGAASAERD